MLGDETEELARVPGLDGSEFGSRDADHLEELEEAIR